MYGIVHLAAREAVCLAVPLHSAPPLHSNVGTHAHTHTQCSLYIIILPLTMFLHKYTQQTHLRACVWPVTTEVAVKNLEFSNITLFNGQYMHTSS